VLVCSNALVLSLVRHGRTQANAAGLLLGRLDPGLDETGRWQASKLPAALGEVDRIIASPLTRTRETAATIGEPVEIDERVIELDYGGLDGRPLDEIPPEIWARWRHDVDFAPDGGETLRTLSLRVSTALDELVDDARDRHVVVVSHVLPIKAGVAWALGVGVEAAWRLHLDQASITRITIGPTGPVVRTYNDIAHLS
jgi:broad specificity phosphatase PhoE